MIGQLITYLNANSGAMTFLITVVYVIATIFICIFNYRSAAATREQVEESKRQFEETKRIELMPYFELFVTDVPPATWNADYFLYISNMHAEESTVIDKKVIIRNIGLGNAKNISYSWINLDGNYNRNDLKFSSIMTGQTQEMVIDFCAEHHTDNNQYDAEVTLIFHYQDLLENSYDQRLTLIFTISEPNKVILKSFTADIPQLTREKHYV